MAPKKSSNRGLLIYVGVLFAAMILIVALMKQATSDIYGSRIPENSPHLRNVQNSVKKSLMSELPPLKIFDF